MSQTSTAVFTISYLILFFLSVYFYKNDPSQYADSKEEKSGRTLRIYEWVNIYLRISTFVVVLLTVFSNHQLLLKIHDNTHITIAGMVLAWGAMYLFIKSRIDLGKNYSPCYDAYLPHSITQGGIYGMVRHPIYTSNIVLLSSIFIASGSLIILLNTMILAYFYNRSALLEEDELSERYDVYKEYMRRTNRYFPSLKR